MKALVLSDSHGSFQSIMNAVESEKDISLIIFAGDIQRDADDIAAAYPDIPFEYVLGNNDWYVNDVPYNRLFEFSGKRIFLTHGHRYNVKSGMYTLRQKGHDVKADICIFGHTHTALIREMDGILMLNPGCARYSYAVLNITGSGVTAEIKKL